MIRANVVPVSEMVILGIFGFFGNFWSLFGGFDLLAPGAMDLGYVGAAWACQMCELTAIDDFAHATSGMIVPQNQAKSTKWSKKVKLDHEDVFPGVGSHLLLNRVCHDESVTARNELLNDLQAV